MRKIIGITGSLRSNSFNSALLRAATGLMPNETTLEIATLKGIPLYDGDLEASEGIPQAVIALQEQIAAADGLLLATPEYNNSSRGYSKMRLTGCRVHPAIFRGFSVAARLQ